MDNDRIRQPNCRERTLIIWEPMRSELGQEALPFEMDGDAPRPISAPSFSVALLALNSVDGLGRKGIRQLVKAYGDDLGTLWASGREQVRKVLEEANVRSIDRIVAALFDDTVPLLKEGQRKAGELGKNRVITLSPFQLPPRLREIPDAPLWLFVQGDDEVLHHRPTVAVVGTRKSSARGRRAAAIVARLLSAYPITLVSGLAEGIDEEAHAVSLEEGAKNVAFLGYGLKHIFPAVTADMRWRIAAGGGALATEYFFDERYHKSYFVERNRLQAALADIVIPVEAESKGGTAHTVRFARQYGRRIVGITWPDAPGMAEELEEAGDEVVNVFERQGRARLDVMFRQLAEKNGHETFALSLVARRLKKELRMREVLPEDMDQLIWLLEDLAGDNREDYGS